MWVVIVIAIVQAISLFRTLWATLKQINRWLRALSNYGANLVRRWLGVPKQITMTQAEYDALPVKEKGTVYMITENR